MSLDACVLSYNIIIIIIIVKEVQDPFSPTPKTKMAGNTEVFKSSQSFLFVSLKGNKFQHVFLSVQHSKKKCKKTTLDPNIVVL